MSFLLPDQVTFNHKKYDNLPVGVQIDHGFDEVPIYDFNTKPNWLDIYDLTTTTLKVRLNANANNLTAATYNETVTILKFIEGPPTGTPTPEQEPTPLFIELILADTLLLDVQPMSSNFVFETGGATPMAKSFNVTSENAWSTSKNASWLNITNGSGNGNGSFSVAVDITGLAPGVYNDTITVDDGSTQKLVQISLTVTAGETGAEYLNIFPLELNFGFTQGGSLPPSKGIDINASDPFTITTTAAWINLPSGNGTAGPQTIQIDLQNLAALSLGDQIGYIDFILAGIVKRVQVNLTIYQLVTETLNSGELYFADDENNVTVSSGRVDTNLQLILNTSFEGKNFNIPYNIPFFQGKASKRIGSEVSEVISDRPIFSLENISVFTPYLPLTADMVFNELEKSSNNLIQTISVNNIKFIKGKYPNNNYLSNLPRTVFLTNKGVLIFSVLSNGTQAGNLIFSDGLDLSIAGPTEIRDYYTAIIPLKEVPGLIPGQSFKVTLLNETIEVILVQSNIEHSILYVENQWGIFEPFELLGEIVEDNSYKNKSFTFRKDHLTTERKVYERKSVESFKINTGYIFSDDMIDYLKKIMQGKNCYLQTPSGSRKVENTTRKLSAYKSLAENRSTDLTFKSVLE